jgi:hypothetical protein
MHEARCGQLPSVKSLDALLSELNASTPFDPGIAFWTVGLARSCNNNFAMRRDVQ